MNEFFNKNTLWRVHLPLLIVQIAFGSLPPFTKLTLKYFPPMSVVFFRIFSTTVLLSLIYFLLKREEIKEKKHFAWFALLGFFGVAGNQLLYLNGISITTAVNAGILVTTIPIFTLLVALLLKKEELSFIKLAGVLIALGGVAYLIDFGRFNLNENILGDFLIICNSCFYAVYLVISKNMLRIYSSFTVITYVFIFSLFLVAPFTLGSITQINYSLIPPEGYFALLMVLVAGTFIPYFVVTFALQNTTSSSVAIYSYLQPVIATSLSAIIVGEEITLKLIISSLIIIMGVSFVTFAGIMRFSRFIKRTKWL